MLFCRPVLEKFVCSRPISTFTAVVGVSLRSSMSMDNRRFQCTREFQRDGTNKFGQLFSIIPPFTFLKVVHHFQDTYSTTLIKQIPQTKLGTHIGGYSLYCDVIVGPPVAVPLSFSVHA